MNKFDQAYNFLSKHNQLHILKHWHELTHKQQNHLYNQIFDIDLNEPNVIVSKQNIIDQINFNQNESNDHILNLTNRNKCELDGLRVIAYNELALITLAGGMSKRLSVSYPKGVYSVDLLSSKSLFQIHAERLIRIKELAVKQFPNRNISLPWYILTSNFTHDATVDFFKENSFFGLDELDVVFFKQKMLPCFYKHKIVLENKYSIKLAPNGSGKPTK